jgi:tetratricopeptide (TPR) repeat protein
MVSTKAFETTIPQIEAKLASFGGDLVKVEYLENVLKQLLPNDVKRFCYLKLADAYALRLMFGLAARNMNAAADCATTPKDKVDFYQKAITYLIKINDFMQIDIAFKKALSFASEQQKSIIKEKLKKDLMSHAQDYERKNKRSSASMVYERLLEMPITTDEERKMLIEKLAKLNSGLGKIKEAIRYETMMKRPLEPRKSRDPDDNLKKVSWQDLGIDIA